MFYEKYIFRIHAIFQSDAEETNPTHAAIVSNFMANEEVSPAETVVDTSLTEPRAPENRTSTRSRTNGEGTSAEAIANTWPVKSHAPANHTSTRFRTDGESTCTEAIANTWLIESRAAGIRNSTRFSTDGEGTLADAIANTWSIEPYAAANVTSQHGLQLELKKEITAVYVEPLRQSVIMFNHQWPIIDLTKDEETVNSPQHLEQPNAMETEPCIDYKETENETGRQQQPFDGLSGDLVYETSPVSVYFSLYYCVLCVDRHFLLFSQSSKDRCYPEYGVTIEAINVVLLKAYNDTKNEETFDERFIYFLVSSILTDEEKVNKCVDKKKIEFAQKSFTFRLRNADDASARMNKFNAHVRLLVRQIRENNRKLQA